jgi:hypothetical protein
MEAWKTAYVDMHCYSFERDMLDRTFVHSPYKEWFKTRTQNDYPQIFIFLYDENVAKREARPGNRLNKADDDTAWNWNVITHLWILNSKEVGRKQLNLMKVITVASHKTQ